MVEDKELISRLIWATCQLAEIFTTQIDIERRCMGKRRHCCVEVGGRNLESFEVRSQVSAGDD